MIVSESRMYQVLEMVLKGNVQEVVRVGHKESLAGLLEHEPTHVIWAWRDEGYSPKGNSWDKEWEVFLTNIEMLGVKVLFLSILASRDLPELVRPLSLRMPVSGDDILSSFRKGGE